MADMGREFGWDDSIEKEGSDFILLPEGDYSFTVESYERGRHEGSEYIPPCPKAILSIRIDTNEGSTFIRHTLFLHSKRERQLGNFFLAIGEKKPGETVRMNWNAVPGATGRARIGVRKGTGNWEGKDFNEIKEFYPKETRTYKAGDF